MPDGSNFPTPLTREERAAKAADRRRRERDEMVAAARFYAAADRTDPFALTRAMAHIDSGVASYRRPKSAEWGIEDRSPGYYTATPFREQRTIKHGNVEMKVDVVAYRNVARP